MKLYFCVESYVNSRPKIEIAVIGFQIQSNTTMNENSLNIHIKIENKLHHGPANKGRIEKIVFSWVLFVCRSNCHDNYISKKILHANHWINSWWRSYLVTAWHFITYIPLYRENDKNKSKLMKSIVYIDLSSQSLNISEVAAESVNSTATTIKEKWQKHNYNGTARGWEWTHDKQTLQSEQPTANWRETKMKLKSILCWWN